MCNITIYNTSCVGLGIVQNEIFPLGIAEGNAFCNRVNEREQLKVY